ncbi:MAG: NAD-dependent deacylase [Bacteroidaceae bacterium]|nr:NAD-dependent deacylase [Bacteroidaceae bacterium]MBR1467686.1 NAD-dependent deacylase [Bacteroidaceae bacterium]
MRRKIVFLTGAGVSAESGVPTFRDSGGLWEGYDVEDVASIGGWYRNPGLMLDFYTERRRAMLSVEPNAAHRAIARLEEWYDVVVITQNVDDLHERGGSTNVIHLHGELSKVCSSRDKETCVKVLPYDIPLRLGDKAEDGSQLRPYIVWFGEDVPNFPLAMEEVSEADILVVVGTSMQVQPAASLIYASHAAEIFVIDPNIPRGLDRTGCSISVLQETATRGMELLLDRLAKS